MAKVPIPEIKTLQLGNCLLARLPNVLLLMQLVGHKTLSAENFDLVQYFSGKNVITDGARAETGLGLSSKAQVLAKACSKGLNSTQVSLSMAFLKN